MQQRISSGFFGGNVLAMNLANGEMLQMESGCIEAFESFVGYDFEFVGSIKSSIFGCEGLIITTLTDPGCVWLQSMPFNKLAGGIAAQVPQAAACSRAVPGAMLAKGITYLTILNLVMASDRPATARGQVNQVYTKVRNRLGLS